MRRIRILALVAATVAIATVATIPPAIPPAIAQNFGNIPPQTVIGNQDPAKTQPAQPIPFSALSAPSSGYGAVPHNAALVATATTTYPLGVWRNDFATGFGAPPLYYRPATAPCSLNAGNGDNGSQVKSADSKCWLAAFSSGVDLAQFGAPVATATPADASAQFNAASAAAQRAGLPLTFSSRSYYVSAAVTLPANVRLDCGASAAVLGKLSSGLQSDYNVGAGLGGVLYEANGATLLVASVSNAITNCYVVNVNVPAHPLTQAAALTAIAAYAGTGITIGSSVYGLTVDNVGLVGFNTCIASTGVGLIRLTRISGDCTTGISQIGGGADVITIRDVELGNFFAPKTTGDTGCLAEYRSGAGVYWQDASAPVFENITTVGYQTGLDINGQTTTLYQPRVNGGHFDSYYYFGDTVVGSDPCTGTAGGTAYTHLTYGIRLRGNIFGGRVTSGTNLTANGVGISIEGPNSQVVITNAQFQSNARGVVYTQGANGVMTANQLMDGSNIANGTATCSIAAKVLTCTTTPLGGIAPGDSLLASGIATNTFVVPCTTSCTGTGGAGTYQVNNSQTIASTAFTIGHADLTVAASAASVRTASNQFFGAPAAYIVVSTDALPFFESIGDWDNTAQRPVYAQGNWVPTLVFSTSNGTLSYTSSGQYRLMAPGMVYLTGQFVVTAQGTGASGSASIGGFPYAVGAIPANGFPGLGNVFANNMANLVGLPVLHPQGNTSKAIITQFGTSGDIPVTALNFQVNSTFDFDMLYPRTQ